MGEMGLLKLKDQQHNSWYASLSTLRHFCTGASADCVNDVKYNCDESGKRLVHGWDGIVLILVVQEYCSALTLTIYF